MSAARSGQDGPNLDPQGFATARRLRLAVVAALLCAAGGCRAAGPPRTATALPLDRLVPRAAADGSRRDPTVQRASMPGDGGQDEDEDEDEDKDEPTPAGRGPEELAVLGSDRPSRSPVLNREGPFGARPGEGPRGYNGASGIQGDVASEEAEYDNENADGFPQPDLLMKALGYEAPATRVYGWVEGAVLFNPADPRNGQNLPDTPSDLANRWQFPQVYLAVERALRNVETVDYGYRFDNLLGTDFVLFNDVRRLDRPFLPNGYGYTPTQAYIDLHLPVLVPGGLDLRVGQFISLAGYESAFAPGRPLRSTGLLFNYSHPFTNIGLLTTLNVTDRFQVFNAPVNGWDRMLDARNQWGYMGGINWDSADERTNVTLSYYAGPNQISRGLPRAPAGLIRPQARRLPGQETALISAVLSQTWTPRWTTVFEIDSGAETAIPIYANDPGVTRNSQWYGAGAWLLYTFSERWTGVVRASGFRDQGGVRTGFDDTYFEAALGLVYKPTPWLWFRPEIDYDGAIGAPPFETRTRRVNNEMFFGFDALFLF